MFVRMQTPSTEQNSGLSPRWGGWGVGSRAFKVAPLAQRPSAHRCLSLPVVVRCGLALLICGPVLSICGLVLLICGPAPILTARRVLEGRFEATACTHSTPPTDTLLVHAMFGVNNRRASSQSARSSLGGAVERRKRTLLYRPVAVGGKIRYVTLQPPWSVLPHQRGRNGVARQAKAKDVLYEAQRRVVIRMQEITRWQQESVDGL